MGDEEKQTKTYSLTEEQYGEFLRANRYESFYFEEAGKTVDVRNENDKKIGTATRNPFTRKITLETDNGKAQKYLEEKGIEGKPIKMTLEEKAEELFRGALASGVKPEGVRRLADVLRKMSPEEVERVLDKMAAPPKKEKQKR